MSMKGLYLIRISLTSSWVEKEQVHEKLNSDMRFKVEERKIVFFKLLLLARNFPCWLNSLMLTRVDINPNL